MKRGAIRLLVLRALGALIGLAPVRGQSGGQPAILMIRPDHLGDVLLTRPAIERVRERLPQARLVVAVGQWGRAALGMCPGHAIWVFPFPGFSRAPLGRLAPYLLLLRAAWSLRRRQPFEAAVILRPDHWWGASLAALAGIPIRIGYLTPENAPFLTISLPYPVGGHAVEHALGLADEVVRRLAGGNASDRQSTASGVGGGAPDGSAEQAGMQVGNGSTEPTPERGPSPYLEAPLLPVSGPADDARVSVMLADRGIEQAPILVLHPGSGSALKSWPLERFASVGKDLAARLDARVVVTGAAGERPEAQTLCALLPGAVNLAGCCTWAELEALLRRAVLIVGVDSGPLHLAAAAGTPSVALFGPADPEQFGPWASHARHRVVAADLPCRPCRRLDYCRLEPDGNGPPPCMRAIDVAPVLAAAASATAGAI